MYRTVELHIADSFEDGRLYCFLTQLLAQHITTLLRTVTSTSAPSTIRLHRAILLLSGSTYSTTVQRRRRRTCLPLDDTSIPRRPLDKAILQWFIQMMALLIHRAFAHG